MSFSPTKKMSKSRSRTRTSNWIKLTALKLKNRVQLQYENGIAIGLSHFASPITGMYKGRKVIDIKSKKKSVTRV
ncbi:MAG: 50S ribosomal protein L32 [Candidatus Gracilibacteria bacterium]|jgi:ribosomal protein L32|nr:50S ribosomal protein L32 [Candidatus Gracilibacteria bacterium]